MSFHEAAIRLFFGVAKRIEEANLNYAKLHPATATPA